MRMGLFGLHSASEQPEVLLMFRNQVASELLIKNERIRQHWAFPAQRWGAGAGPGTSCPPSHGLCRWLGPARPLPPLCRSWSLRTSEFADLWGPGPSQRIPSCDPFLLSKVKAECAGGPDRSQRAGLPALPPLSPRIRSLPPCTERVLRPGRAGVVHASRGSEWARKAPPAPVGHGPVGQRAPASQGRVVSPSHGPQDTQPFSARPQRRPRPRQERGRSTAVRGQWHCARRHPGTRLAATPRSV